MPFAFQAKRSRLRHDAWLTRIEQSTAVYTASTPTGHRRRH
jgi:hypothetical protein